MSELADSMPADSTYIVVYPQGLGNMNAAGAAERQASGFSRGTSTPSWNGGGCAQSPGPLGETCRQFASGNTEMYGTMDLHYESCPDNSYCNCCSCADDVGFVRALLAWLEDSFCIDRRRVYATGCSYGGMMTYQLGLSMPGTFAAFAPAFGGLLKGFADVPPPAAAGAAAGWTPILDIHGWYDPWVPANDTHGCRTGDEPGCVGGGDGYAWPESSELEDGWATSDDGWYYTPVDTLLGRFAQYSGCAEEPDAALWPRWEPPMLEDAAAAETAAADSLYCVAASECRGGAGLARCSWEGGHSWKREWMPQLVWGFFSTYARGDIGVESPGSGAEAAQCPPDSEPVPSPALLQSAAGRSCPILLDVRTEDEWNAGHASCAVRLPVQDDPGLNATVLSMAGGVSTKALPFCCASTAFLSNLRQCLSVRFNNNRTARCRSRRTATRAAGPAGPRRRCGPPASRT
eukprot:SAG22_NODE_1850_length_3446_cov_2.774425_1_plen_461_part_00